MRWQRTVEFAFRHHYLIPLHLEIEEGKIDPQEVERYGQIIEVLEGDKRPVAARMWEVMMRTLQEIGVLPPGELP